MRTELEKLKSIGCDTSAALARCVDDEDFYFDCVTETLKDSAFEALGTALAAGDVAQAFNEAHTLKGLLANMGLTPLYDILVKIVEPLRVKNGSGLEPFYRELLAERDRIRELVGV